jgi:GNAT superfamily N-acetyltransferase
VSAALTAHLRSWVGEWPPRPGITVVGDPARLQPTWDGSVRLLQGAGDGVGAVLSVPPDAVGDVRAALAGRHLGDPSVGDRLGAALGLGPSVLGAGVLRWTHLPAAVPPAGTWIEPPGDGRLPPWLAPFNGRRLVAWDRRGGYVAGVGLKVHDRWGQELAVVTSPAARGRGLARRLVATAARRILAEGCVPTYLHDPANRASARVADAAGFPDRGWTVLGLWPRR